jgi:hypothetical protein
MVFLLHEGRISFVNFVNKRLSYILIVKDGYKSVHTSDFIPLLLRRLVILEFLNAHHQVVVEVLQPQMSLLNSSHINHWNSPG